MKDIKYVGAMLCHRLKSRRTQRYTPTQSQFLLPIFSLSVGQSKWTASPPSKRRSGSYPEQKPGQIPASSKVIFTLIFVFGCGVWDWLNRSSWVISCDFF